MRFSKQTDEATDRVRFVQIFVGCQPLDPAALCATHRASDHQNAPCFSNGPVRRRLAFLAEIRLLSDDNVSIPVGKLGENAAPDALSHRAPSPSRGMSPWLHCDVVPDGNPGEAPNGALRSEQKIRAWRVAGDHRSAFSPSRISRGHQMKRLRLRVPTLPRCEHAGATQIGGERCPVKRPHARLRQSTTLFIACPRKLCPALSRSLRWQLVKWKVVKNVNFAP